MPNTKPIGVAFTDPQLDDAIIGEASGTVGFYGKAALVRRPYSAAVHNTTGIATSASFGATQLAAVHELQLTLIGLGIYATA